MRGSLSLLILLFFVFVGVKCQDKEFVLPVLVWNSTLNTATGVVTSLSTFGNSYALSLEIALSDYKKWNPDSVTIRPIYRDEMFSGAISLQHLIEYYNGGATYVAGNVLSDTDVVSGQAATVYGVAQLSGTANTAVLSNKVTYPYFSRCYLPTQGYVGSVLAILMHYLETSGIGWDKVAILATTDSYGLLAASDFISRVKSEKLPLKVLTYQTILVGQTDMTVEMREIKNSGARVVVTFIISSYQYVVLESVKYGLVGPTYVWIAGSGTTGQTPWIGVNNTIDEAVLEGMRGTIGTLPFIPRSGPIYQSYLEQWQAQDPTIIPGTGNGTIPGTFFVLAYDVGYISARVIDEIYKMGRLFDDVVPVDLWVNTTRSLTIDGATGTTIFESNGDRLMTIGIAYFSVETKTWVTYVTWNATQGFSNFTLEPIWNDNTTNIPDLDIREPFKYWSCHKKEKGYDPTGKTIKLERPDGDDVNYIESHYYCDSFIDCKNISDESSDGCSSNYVVVFIVFGIITGFLILMALLFLPFVIVFGWIIPRTRIRATSPLFMIFLIFTCILGYISTFTWYGKPHPVACGFQPWLLGLAVVSMVSCLCAKTFRIWRIFKSPWNKTVITDFELVILWIIMVIPAFIILIIWTIVSTPAAKMEERDGDDHYVCTTGGFTGYPGGYVFFFILVAYEGLMLVIGAFLSFVTRNVNNIFNESKLLAISIYNLAFLAIIVIPVIIVLSSIDPFAAWIIREVAILYAFTATLWLQFLPKIYSLAVKDKFKDKKLQPRGRSNLGSTSLTQSVDSRS